MKLIKILSCLSVVLFIANCTTKKNIVTEKTQISTKKAIIPVRDFSIVKEPNHIYFSILQLNDVAEISPIQSGQYGGLARVETIHKELLKADPNTMIVMAGNFLTSSLLGSLKYNEEQINGKQMVDVMNEMAFDLVTFGKNDFQMDYKELQGHLDNSSFDWVSANVFHNINGQAHYFHKIIDGKKYTIFDNYIKDVYDGKNLIKVGFVSLSNSSTSEDYVTYSDVFIEAERSYNEVNNTADVVVALTNLSEQEDKELAKLFPKIKLIMGGNATGNDLKNIGNINICKADPNAKTIYIHRFDYDILTKETKVKSTLLTIDETIPEDKEVKKVVAKWENILLEKVKTFADNPKEVIYRTNIILNGEQILSKTKQTNLGQFITKSMRMAYENIDCALLDGGSIKINEDLIGDITPVEIFKMFPNLISIYKVKIKGNLLKKVLDFGEKSKWNDTYIHHDNVSKINDNWTLKNENISDDKIYNVAVSSSLFEEIIPILVQNNTELSVYKPTEKEVAYDIRKAIIKYLKNKKRD